MLKKYFLPILALSGAIFGLYTVFWTQKTVPTPPILFPPSKSPYPYSIAGAGIIEASSENIAVASPFNEIIEEIYVVEGDIVAAGDPLFKLNTENFEAQAKAAQANVNAAAVDLLDKKTQFAFYQRLQDKRAVSEQVFEQSHYQYLTAEENLSIAIANLNEINVNIERSTIRAPIAGQILQVNIHKGEIGTVTPLLISESGTQAASQGSLILMGKVDPLQLRINIDENDAWRYEKGARATAFVRGNSRIHFPIEFNRIEPFIIPKGSFTGDTRERVDTRVLQVLYTFEKKDLPVFPGQILDVYFEAKPIEPYVVK